MDDLPCPAEQNKIGRSRLCQSNWLHPKWVFLWRSSKKKHTHRYHPLHLVDTHQVAFLFGCTSFAGNDSAVFKNAFGLLADKFQGQGALLPQPLSDQTYITPCGEYDPTAALREMPPLLRSY